MGNKARTQKESMHSPSPPEGLETVDERLSRPSTFMHPAPTEESTRLQTEPWQQPPISF